MGLSSIGIPSAGPRARAANASTPGRARRFLAWGSPLVSLLSVFSGCGGRFDSCEASRSCPPGDAGGGTAGASGGSGSGGGAAAGLSSAGLGGNSEAGGGSGGDQGGNAGSAGQGGTQAGASGAGGTPPCDGACGGATPACDESTSQCVECLARGDCGGTTPACEATTHTCVACAAKADCKGTTPFCDTTAHTCVACLTNTDCKAATPVCHLPTNTCVACLKQADCTDPMAPQCDVATHSCEPCTTDAQCSDITGKNVCLTGACVECTSEKFSDCGSDQGTPLVCDSLKHTCTTEKARSAGLCQPCVSDAQCALGELCVLDTLGSGSTAKQVGYFCHWKKADTANGAPADCLATGRPYAGTLANATSIDGETADICTLRASSCPANNEFSAKNCAPTGTPDDTLCGVSAPLDAKCVQGMSSSTYLCTMTCLSDFDCPSPAVCKTTVSPRVCSL